MTDPQVPDDKSLPPDDEKPVDRDSEKPETSDPLVEVVSSTQVERKLQPPSAPRLTQRQSAPTGQVVLRVEHLAGQRMAYHVEGARSLPPRRDGPLPGWAIDFGALNIQMRDLGHYLAMSRQANDAAMRAAWRRTVDELGQHMYDGLLAVDSQLARTLFRLRRWTRPAHRLTLAFAGPATYLSVPYELLYDSETGESLALRHPICRQVSDGPSVDGETWVDLMVALRARHEPLRVLLISSGAEQLGTTDEISALELVFGEMAAQGVLRIQVDMMLAGDATPAHIRARLRACPYHIVHYVGQVYHDPLHPDQSGWLFAARHEAQLGQVVLSGADLADLLAGGATRLVYVSAGIERADVGAHLLRTEDDLPIVRSIVRAGVPYVIGLRWYVPPASRQRLAAEFYRQVCVAPFAPELALLRARQALTRANEDDETWTAPLMVAQHVYLGDE